MLTLLDIHKLLDVPRDTIFKWVEDGELLYKPCRDKATRVPVKAVPDTFMLDFLWRHPEYLTLAKQRIDMVRNQTFYQAFKYALSKGWFEDK